MIEVRRHLLQTLPRVIAHRGASGEAPENTLAAIRLAHQRGARWIEVDAKISADRVCFLLHDVSVDRTTNGSGKAVRLGWQELRQLDAGSYYSNRFAGELLPSLKDMIDLLSELDMGANIEIKPSPGHENDTGELVAAETRRLWPESLPMPILSSFSITSIMAARRVAPDLPRGLLVDRWDNGIHRRLDELECHSLHIKHKSLDLAVLGELRLREIPVLVYTVNDTGRAVALIRHGAVSIITDWPREIGKAIDSV